MPDIASLLQQGSHNLWLFVPSALLLGALHGLEPGHSKTMMAAFIVAIRGTVWQAVMLGLAATVSHTAIVWLIAIAGLYYGPQFYSESTEPYLQLVSAALIIAIALWMLWRTWRETHKRPAHHHHDETREIDTGHGALSVEIFEDGVPSCWRVRFLRGETFDAGEVSLDITRSDGSMQTFAFQQHGSFLQSTHSIPEPHSFKAELALSHGDHMHRYAMAFEEHHHHADGAQVAVTNVGEFEDAHQRAHADDINRRFAASNVTTGQIIMFGLTGGLIPCPASITVLLICLQLKQFTLGASLVLCFSIGLAVTMVSIGAVAALGVGHVSKRWSGFDQLVRRAPYLSGVLIILVGLYTGYAGWSALAGV
ncbi:MAG: nickel/cobalt efflux transporter [Micropepsaceae bacterium]